MADCDLPINDFDPQTIATRLERVRERTVSLIAGLDWEVLTQQQISILSPMVWDLGHIANFEESWLCQEVGDAVELHLDYAHLFDAVIHPRPTRKDLPLPVAGRLMEYMAEVRMRALDILDRLDSTAASELWRNGFVYELVAEHEEQHQETLLQAMQILEDPLYAPAQRRRLPPGRAMNSEMIEIPGGRCRIGADGTGFAYDNEMKAHEVEVGDFLIDSAPVACGVYRDFVDDGGYARPELWSPQGWQWCRETGALAPANWQRTASGWVVRWMNLREPLRSDLPVTHVCYWEAEAFSRWAGKRLPTEIEWEKAALWDPIE
ncbi:MAG: SUMF1/EgtB/PvdO family nonheme iron enzyme, partial [Acidobacteriota bacterium]